MDTWAPPKKRAGVVTYETSGERVRVCGDCLERMRAAGIRWCRHPVTRGCYSSVYRGATFAPCDIHEAVQRHAGEPDPLVGARDVLYAPRRGVVIDHQPADEEHAR